MNKKNNYPGGKNSQGVYQRIINLIPPHDVYIEAFLGSGAILKNKLPSKYSIALDLNEKCIDNFRHVDNAGTILIKGDGISFLRFYYSLSILLKNYGIRSFIYLDPPYPIETRSNKKRIYKHEMSSVDHIELLKVIGSTKIPTMISTYDNDVYKEKLKSWKKEKYKVRIRRRIAEETIYMNYEIKGELHDYRYIGKNFREREKNRGIIKRNVSKYKRLPISIKKAILQKIIDIE